MGIQVVRVEVDVHEPTALREELSRLGADVRIRLLPIGDVRTGDALVERKTVRDLPVNRIACRASHSRAPRNRPLYAQRPKRSEPEAVLAAIPDISTVTARALLSHFGSIAAVVKAPDADLREVHGVGPVRSRTIRETFTQTHRAYRSRRSRE